MKIAQITDIHIARAGVDTYGVDVRAQLQSVLRDALARGAERLVLTGDLCFTSPQPEIYRWVHAQLATLPIPFAVISGNHDDSAQVAAQFSHQHNFYEADGELYWMEHWGSVPVFFLDTAKGTLSARQYAWLAQRLSALQQDPLIFMHHPPFPLQVPYMDSVYPYTDPASFLRLFQDCTFHAHIFVGHYHVDKIAVQGNVSVYACPSTFYQMGQRKAAFSVDHHRPGYRMISYQEGALIVSAHYLPEISQEVHT